MQYLNYIVTNEHFIVCELKSTDWFIKYCDERGVKTSRKQLERFEQLGLFYPIARVRHHQTSFWFRTDHAKTLLDEGLIWDPSQHPFQPWETFRDEDRNQRIENFYSVFQCYSLRRLQNTTKLSEVRAEHWAFHSEEKISEIVVRLTRLTQGLISQLSAATPNEFHLAAVICQIISNRYFPLTQTDRRSIQISSGHTLGEWDWFEYGRIWNANTVLADLGIDPAVVERLCTSLKMYADRIDPMEMWSELVSFISIEKKGQLKGDAQLALTLRSMGNMLNMFHRELTGKEIHLLDRSPEDIDEMYGGEGVSANNLEYLEYLANEYHLNPRPKLILVVEGHGEYEQFPRVAWEVFGSSFSHLEIEVINLQGMAGFTGVKKRDKYGALEKFIDFNHDRQTIVFVVLDNEGDPRPDEIKHRLVSKDSAYFAKRKVTRDEYISIWNTNVEFDNFTNEEIAKVLNEMCNHEYEILPDEIEPHRHVKKGDPLEDLFSEKTAGKYQWNKRTLLQKLFDAILAVPVAEFERRQIGEKPVIKLLERVLNLAQLNHQPGSRDAWTENQASGFFGHTSGEAEDRTRDTLRQI